MHMNNQHGSDPAFHFHTECCESACSGLYSNISFTKKRKLVIGFAFHSCSTCHGKCTATRLCATVSSSQFTWRTFKCCCVPGVFGEIASHGACFDTGAQACRGTMSTDDSISYMKT